MLTSVTSTFANHTRTVIQKTHDYIVTCQQENGAILWFDDGKLDPWDHTEAAMGLAINGNWLAARKAFTWLVEHQNPNGSWYAKYYGDTLDNDNDRFKIETNFVAYPACGLWHYFLITKDIEFVKACFPYIANAINFVIEQQTREGDIQWALSDTEPLPKDALVTACSSILRSLECAIYLAEAVNTPNKDWLNAYLKLADALKNKPWRFDRTWDSKDRFSMDWFYPVLAGIYTREEAQLRLSTHWQTFVQPDMGCRCVSDEPWITVAESCELTMALIASGRRPQAHLLFENLLKWQDDDGGFWTGYSFRDEVIWPREKTSWTAAAVILAADALENITPAARLFTTISPLI